MAIPRNGYFDPAEIDVVLAATDAARTARGIPKGSSRTMAVPVPVSGHMFPGVTAGCTSTGSVSYGGTSKSKAKKRGLNKTKGGKPIVYLIDADTHAYRAAAAADGRFYECEDCRRFKYKKDADAWCKSQALKYPPALAYEPEPAANALKLLSLSLEEFDGRTCEYFLTGKTNFRYNIVPDYKGNRKGGRVPQHLKVCKEAIVDRGAVWNKNLEADDLVIIRAKQLERSKIPWVIVGCDKDLKQIPGSFYDPFSGKREIVTEAGARYNLWKQIATGDSTDNIKSPKGLGPATFDKWFKGVDWDKHTDWDLLCLMVGLYKSKAPIKAGESENIYTARILMWVKMVASLVFLRRADDEEYQLPTRGGSPDRSTRVYDLTYADFSDPF